MVGDPRLGSDEKEVPSLFIDPIPTTEAEGMVARMYAEDQARAGYVPVYTQVFSHHPEAYQAWITLITSIRENMDLRRCELATLAAARALRSTNCSIAHGKVLRDRFYESEQVVRIASDHRHADLDEVDVAVMDFAERAADDPSQITRSEVQNLKELGLSDRDILDVVLSVAARAFFATVVEALGAPPERPMVEDLEPRLLDVLTVGRPIPPE